MSNALQQVVILGATGSIGRNTLAIIAQAPQRYQVYALSAFNNVDLLFDQCCQFQPKLAVMVDEKAATVLRERLAQAHLAIEVLAGVNALNVIAALPEVDTVVAAIVGASGLASTMAALQAGKKVLLANKESLIVAGELMMTAARQHRATIIPVDSEHNAIFQCLPADYRVGNLIPYLKEIVLTASGGPFLNRTPESLSDVTPEEACQHPNWRMGAKISVDSATMMNKGFELIEACWLFNLKPEQVRVIVHPQSVIHSMVHFCDGSYLAQLGLSDMQIPIAYALAHPERLNINIPSLDWRALAQLNFFEPSLQQFPCLHLAYEALRMGGAQTAVLNAANEVAVQAFLQKKISFSDIAELNDNALQQFAVGAVATIDDLLEIDRRVRVYVDSLVSALVS